MTHALKHSSASHNHTRASTHDGDRSHATPSQHHHPLHLLQPHMHAQKQARHTCSQTPRRATLGLRCRGSRPPRCTVRQWCLAQTKQQRGKGCPTGGADDEMGRRQHGHHRGDIATRPQPPRRGHGSGVYKCGTSVGTCPKHDGGAGGDGGGGAACVHSGHTSPRAHAPMSKWLVGSSSTVR
jgi:hypothetical protein